VCGKKQQSSRKKKKGSHRRPQLALAFWARRSSIEKKLATVELVAGCHSIRKLQQQYEAVVVTISLPPLRALPFACRSRSRSLDRR